SSRPRERARPHDRARRRQDRTSLRRRRLLPILACAPTAPDRIPRQAGHGLRAPPRSRRPRRDFGAKPPATVGSQREIPRRLRPHGSRVQGLRAGFAMQFYRIFRKMALRYDEASWATEGRGTMRVSLILAMALVMAMPMAATAQQGGQGKRCRPGMTW